MGYYKAMYLGNVDQGDASLEDYKARVQAVGVALLFAYLVIHPLLSSIISFKGM